MRIPVPFKYRERSAAYESHASRAEIHEAYRASKERDIPLSLLRSTQRTVGSERLLQFASDPNTPAHNGPPVVLQSGGKYYIHNGHHRATLAAMRGDRTIRARVAHLDAQAPRPFGHLGQLLMMQPQATSVMYQAHDVEDVADVIDGGIAVISIETPLEDKPGSWWSFFDDYESIHCRFANAIESDDVRGILLKLDSPGGSAAGLNECVDSMLRIKAKTGKPVWAYADEGAYSAAYAIALVGDRIYLPRAGGLGSIGVISQIVSFDAMNKKAGVDFRVYTSGARKADGNPNLPISSGAESHVQRRVDGLAKIYFKLAAERRGVSRSYVRGLEADTFYGKHAVRKKLADGVCSLESCVESFRKEIDRPTANKVSSSGRGNPQRTKSEKAERSHGMLPEQKRVNKATTALASASGSKAKAAALIEFNAANAALTKALSKPEAGKHYKKTETLDHSSESSSSASGSEEEEMPSASASSRAPSASSSSGSEEEETAEEEETHELAAAAKKITGRSSAKEALGALLAMGESAQRTTKSEKRIAKLEAERVSGKIDALIAQGKIDCKVTPGNEKKLRAIGAKYGYRALRANLEASSPAVLPELPDPPLDSEVEAVKLSASDKKILAKMGVDESMHGRFSKYMARRDAERAGKSIPERGMPKDLVSRAKPAGEGE